MCISPTYIDNVYSMRSRYLNKKREYIGIDFLHDCFSKKMVVPCGVCPECLFLKQQYILQRVQLLCTDHAVFFGTLTYNNKHLPSHVDSLGNVHYYVDSNHFYHMLHRIRFRKEIPDNTKILYVEEYGGKKHRPHIHFMLFYPLTDSLLSDFRACRELLDKEEERLYSLFRREWSINVGTRKHPILENLYTYKCVKKHGIEYKNFDFHLVRKFTSNSHAPISPEYENKDENDVAAYVTKYVLKFDEWFRKKKQYLYSVLPSDEYDRIIKLIRPKVTLSKHFGDSPKYEPLVRKGIEYALSQGINFKGFKFFDSKTGKYKPLCPYLRKKFLKFDDMMTYWFTCSRPNNYSESNVVVTQYDSRERGIDISLQKLRHGKSIQEHLFNINYDDCVCIEEFNL